MPPWVTSSNAIKPRPWRARRRPAKPEGSGRDQRHLDGFGALSDELKTFLKSFEWQLMRADAVHREGAGLEHPDGGRPAVRTEVGAEHIELLVVADDAPVDGDVGPEDAVLHITAELAEQVHPRRPARRGPGGSR